MLFINSLISGVEDLDYRVHLRNEFFQLNLGDIMKKLHKINHDDLNVQLERFTIAQEDDYEEIMDAYEDTVFKFEYEHTVFIENLC